MDLAKLAVPAVVVFPFIVGFIPCFGPLGGGGERSLGFSSGAVRTHQFFTLALLAFFNFAGANVVPVLHGIPPTSTTYTIETMPESKVLNPSSRPIGKGIVSPLREVPAHITKPEYVGKSAPAPFTGSEVKSDELIERMRIVCRLAAKARDEVGRHIGPGVTTDELDRIGHEFICDHGAYPSPLGYRGFPKSLCSSVNEVVCHGVPDSTTLMRGDICNIDITCYQIIDGVGVHGDTNATFAVGDLVPEVADLVAHTREALQRGIKAVRPGREVNIIGRVIESYAKRHGYGVVQDYTGHGIGEWFHSGLIIPHYDAAPRYDDVIEPGMTFTIEPMLNLGTGDCEVWDDDWTVVSADRSYSAQFEHTVLVTESGAEILTLPEPA